MALRFFKSGLTKQELMKRAFRIKHLAYDLSPETRAMVPGAGTLHFTMPTDLEIGSLDRPLLTKVAANMLAPLRTMPLTLHACGGGEPMPITSEVLAAVPRDILYTASAFSYEQDKAQPTDGSGHQRILVTWYKGELPPNIKNQYIIYDGLDYSPSRRMMEELNRIPVVKPFKLKLPKM